MRPVTRRPLHPPAQLDDPVDRLVRVLDREVRVPVRRPQLAERLPDPQDGGHRAPVEQQRRGVLRRLLPLGLETERRPVERQDTGGLPGHQLVPQHRPGDPLDGGAPVLAALPDPEGGTRGVGRQGHPPGLLRVQRAHPDRAAAVPHGPGRLVHVVRRQIGRPRDRQRLPLGHPPDPGHHPAVQQRPRVRPELFRSGPELPAEEPSVELLARHRVVGHQAHPAGCAGHRPLSSLIHRLPTHHTHLPLSPRTVRRRARAGPAPGPHHA